MDSAASPKFNSGDNPKSNFSTPKEFYSLETKPEDPLINPSPGEEHKLLDAAVKRDGR